MQAGASHPKDFLPKDLRRLLHGNHSQALMARRPGTQVALWMSVSFYTHFSEEHSTWPLSSGNIAELIAAVAARSEELGDLGQDDETSPAAIAAKTLRYLKNQRSRMKYAQYRKLGLPITSSHIESTIKQINRRVKGSEKFWYQGAEPILRLAADHLSETNAFDHFWRNRQHQLQHTRRYQTTRNAA